MTSRASPLLSLLSAGLRVGRKPCTYSLIGSESPAHHRHLQSSLREVILINGQACNLQPIEAVLHVQQTMTSSLPHECIDGNLPSITPIAERQVSYRSPSALSCPPFRYPLEPKVPMTVSTVSKPLLQIANGLLYADQCDYLCLLCCLLIRWDVGGLAASCNAGALQRGDIPEMQL